MKVVSRNSGATPARQERRLRKPNTRSTCHYFGSLIPGPQGELWIQAYVADRASAVQYVVVDSAGRPRGQVSVPKGCRVREVGLDYVLVVCENEDGVESVRLHRLDRRGE
jgi:hypothetical protein